MPLLPYVAHLTVQQNGTFRKNTRDSLMSC